MAEREGTLPLELTFVAAVRENGDWRSVDFAMPAGAVVPLELTGLAEGVTFQPDPRVVPPKLAASAASNEAGYLTHKVVRSLGMLAFDNQARV